jgi:predicted MPP superfamily phosphohydrolase
VTPIWGFRLASVALWLAAVIAARVVRGRLYATFAGVLLGVHSLIALGIASRIAELVPHGLVLGVPWPMLWLHLAVYLHFILLVRPRMRSIPFRALVSVPASFFLAGTLMAFPWAIAAAAGFAMPGIALPYAIALLGLIQSLFARDTEVDLVLSPEKIEGLRRHRQDARVKAHREERPLSIVQISDPHLGPFMSVDRLRKICERAVARRPDLILLTGDFLTMESQSDPKHLDDALSPLAALPGRVFACMGNHDHEAPQIVLRACEKHGIRMLIDESVTIDTEAGPVQLLGIDYHFRDRTARIAAACERHPRLPDHLRLVLLHDPWSFRHLPEGEGDLVLSGHTHGGQVGLLSLGASWTFLRLFGDAMPDHGLWARGSDRLYVHRGTGHYGFPLRLGVPSEEGLLRIHRVRG